jgi:acyl carrier protein
MMTDQVVLDQIKRIVVEDLDLNLSYDQLDETVPLFEEGLALDSVILVELISFIEKRFEIQLDDDMLNTETFKNLRSIAEVIRGQLAQKQQTQM